MTKKVLAIITSTFLVVGLLIWGANRSSSEKQSKAVIFAINSSWETSNVKWITTDSGYTLQANLRAIRGNNRSFQLDAKTMSYFCGGLLTTLPSKPIPSITRNDVDLVRFNFRPPKGRGFLLPYDAVVSVKNGSCQLDGYIDAPYANIEIIGKLGNDEYALALKDIKDWSFDDFKVVKKNGDIKIVALYDISKLDTKPDRQMFFSACRVALNSLPITVKVLGKEYDLKQLNQLTINAERRKSLAMFSAKTSSQFTFEIKDGLCVF